MQCAIAGDELVKDIALFPHPDKWTYIVICDDASWNSDQPYRRDRAVVCRFVARRRESMPSSDDIKSGVELRKPFVVRDSFTRFHPRHDKAHNLTAEELMHIQRQLTVDSIGFEELAFQREGLPGLNASQAVLERGSPN
jgi:hypothetical protein